MSCRPGKEQKVPKVALVVGVVVTNGFIEHPETDVGRIQKVFVIANVVNIGHANYF